MTKGTEALIILFTDSLKTSEDIHVQAGCFYCAHINIDLWVPYKTENIWPTDATISFLTKPLYGFRQ